MLHHFSFSLLGNAYAAPSCILAALWSRRRCAGEAQPALYSHLLTSTDLHTPLQISTPSMRLQRRTRKARLDRGSCPTMRPVKGSPEDKWSSELCKEGKCFCVLVNVVQQRICVWLPSLVKAQWRTCWGCAGRIGKPPWLQLVLRCEKGFYGCTHCNKTSIMMYRVSQKQCSNRTKS